MKKYLSIISTLTLIACSDQENMNNNPSKTTLKSDSVIQQTIDTAAKKTADSTHQQRQSILQEVDKDTLIIANGTEPGWILTLFENKFIFVGNYGQDTISESYNKINIQQFPIEYKSKNITFKLEKKKCIAASGEELNISANIIFQGKHLQGCGKILK